MNSRCILNIPVDCRQKNYDEPIPISYHLQNVRHKIKFVIATHCNQLLNDASTAINLEIFSPLLNSLRIMSFHYHLKTERFEWISLTVHFGTFFLVDVLQLRVYPRPQDHW